MYVESANINIGNLIDYQIQRVSIDLTTGHVTASVILNGSLVQNVATSIELELDEVTISNLETKCLEVLDIVFGLGGRPNDRNL